MADDVAARPFYGEYAWAFDLLIDRPVAGECRTIAAWLAERGVHPGATVLDAGCGTGRYANELSRLGYLVTGIDRSAELIALAMGSAAGLQSSASFIIGDILDLDLDVQAAHENGYDAVLCRGVLNDLIGDDVRESAFAAFRRVLRGDGVLVLDVRDWDATVQRKTREPVFKKTVTTDCGVLTFTSVTALDPDNRQLVLTERHVLAQEGNERSSDYRFVMQCWTQDELNSRLCRAGFAAVAYFGAYDVNIHPGATDRLVAVAAAAAQRSTVNADDQDASRSLKQSTWPSGSST